MMVGGWRISCYSCFPYMDKGVWLMQLSAFRHPSSIIHYLPSQFRPAAIKNKNALQAGRFV
jgi:hypothetical protein